MRIVIDMQGAQADNRNRGLGRYTLAFAKAIVLNRRHHEVFLALNGLFPESVDAIRNYFDGLLPQENIRVWHAPNSVSYADENNFWRRSRAECVREAFIKSLNPDIVHIGSLFEGLGDDAVTSIGLMAGGPPVAVTVHDLIPLIYPESYLGSPRVKAWYDEKIEHLKRASLWIAISESSRKECIDYLKLPEGGVVNCSEDVGDIFKKNNYSLAELGSLKSKYRLHRDFVMYTGGIDPRKNIEGLIRAYAMLPKQLRDTHQLAIVCSILPADQSRLNKIAREQGLGEGEVIFTGFVSEQDLVAFYNLCALFVFPSLHEGFGLPVLEAMRCGAPMIASNVSSLPEVVGLEEALFDPRSEEAIAHAIERVLIDVAFRERLIEHGKEQAKKFSWDASARRAIASMERAVSDLRASQSLSLTRGRRPRLAYVSPLPPERSGISDYSAELLPALAQHYEIEVVVAQGSVSDAWVTQNCPVRTVEWFLENSDRFDRVLYHFGNSAFHQHMFGLLKKIPGVVVLHDFYLSGVLYHMDALGYAPGFFAESLYQSHGYIGLLDRFQAKDVAEVIWKYPCSREVLEDSVGTIFHSESGIRLAESWYGEGVNDCCVIPLMRVSAEVVNASRARKILGISEEEFVVCSFGMLGPTKLNIRLLTAWLASGLAKSGKCRLVFVGENHGGDYGYELLSLMKRHPHGSSVFITGWVDQHTFRQYLSAADMGVQLRTLSRGETSAAVLDCMNYGLATIVNANGSMADLDNDAVWKLPDEFDDRKLIEALEALWCDHYRRRSLGERAKALINEKHDPTRCAVLYKNAIEDFYARNRPVLKELITAIAMEPIPDRELLAISETMAWTFPRYAQPRQLLVDISELVQHDAKTGIQRVVRNILREWLLHPPPGYRVEPVYAKVDQSYRYARQFTAHFLGITLPLGVDEPIEFTVGDVFFALDLQPQVQTAHADFYQKMRRQGGTVKFMVYDLLCILQPQYFVQGAAEGFSNWLQVVCESDGAVCISNAVADELAAWMRGKTFQRRRSYSIEWNHLGADIEGTPTSKESLETAGAEIERLQRGATFLMVGTIEPRKGHEQVLDAFERLWQAGFDANLVIVGKQGWMVEHLVERLRGHPERENLLFWLEGVSDEYLEKIYAAGTCLIAASYGEGFGLPLIEAAQHKLPIFARDIPVFREVAGNHASYFNATTAEEMAEAILAWFDLYAVGKHPKSEKMPWLTWSESACALAKILT